MRFLNLFFEFIVFHMCVLYVSVLYDHSHTHYFTALYLPLLVHLLLCPTKIHRTHMFRQ